MKTKPSSSPVVSKLTTALAFALPGGEPLEAPSVNLTSITVLPPMVEGGFYARDGRGPFTYDIEEIVANTKANGADIPVYLDHQTSGPASGWIDHTADPTRGPDGGWDWPVSYTPEGTRRLKERDYRYTSMGFRIIPDKRFPDQVAGRIHSFYENSLVTRPAFRLRAIASEQAAGAYTSGTPSTSTKVRPMTPEQLALLGLTAEATAEQITTALTSLTAQAALATAVVAAAGAPAEADAAQVVQAAANSQVVAGALFTAQAFQAVAAERDAAVLARTAAETALTAQAAERNEQAAVAAVDAAIAGGKFVPAAREGLLTQARADLATFNVVASAMAVHPAARSVQAAQAPGPEATTEADAGAAYATQMLGIKSSVYEAGKKA